MEPPAIPTSHSFAGDTYLLEERQWRDWIDAQLEEGYLTEVMEHDC